MLFFKQPLLNGISNGMGMTQLAGTTGTTAVLHMIEEFPNALYKPWCSLYLRFAVDHQACLTNLLQRSKHTDVQAALNEAAQDLPVLVLALDAKAEDLAEPDLLRVYACLKELEQFYRSSPWQYRQGGKAPEVRLYSQRYVLRSPPRGYIVNAIPKEQRFTSADLIGRDRVLGLRYRWTRISAETKLDWDYTLALDALLTEPQLRVGFSPIAGVTEMRWHSNCADRRGPRGEVPIRCMEAYNDEDIWQRIEAVLRCAYQRGVQVLLFPELVFTQPLLDKTIAWLESNNLLDPVLRLVVAGTRHVDSEDYPGEFCNRCTVLDASGSIAWIQDKRQCFTLEAEDLRSLLPGFDAPAAFEPSQLSSNLVVRETAIGRILTSICLDYINEDIWGKLGADLHLVPAMSAGLSRFRDRGRQLGNLSGVTSLVCNARLTGDTNQRLMAYIPSKRVPLISRQSDDLFTLDIEFHVN